MALSNKFGWLVLTTGNKSEMSVGYTTLYGDLAGGFAVIKDVPKTLVYRLCEWRNSPAGRRGARRAAERRADPASIIERAPSAELRPDQRDEDSLPPYEVLDRDPRGLRRAGPEPRAADRAGAARSRTSTARSALVDLAEYKRRQAPPGIKITDAGLRARPAHADHQPLPGLTGAPRGGWGPDSLPACVSPSFRWPPSARCALASCGDTLQDKPIPAQHARGHDRRPLPRLLARRLLQGPRDHRSGPRSERCLQRPVRRLPAGRTGHLHPSPADRDLARQQLPAGRLHGERRHPDQGPARARDRGGAHDRGPHRRRRRRHLRQGLPAPRSPPPGRSFRSTSPALRGRPFPRGCPTRASARPRCPPSVPPPRGRSGSRLASAGRRRPSRRSALRRRGHRANGDRHASHRAGTVLRRR